MDPQIQSSLPRENKTIPLFKAENDRRDDTTAPRRRKTERDRETTEYSTRIYTYKIVSCQKSKTIHVYIYLKRRRRRLPTLTSLAQHHHDCIVQVLHHLSIAVHVGQIRVGIVGRASDRVVAASTSSPIITQAVDQRNLSAMGVHDAAIFVLFRAQVAIGAPRHHHPVLPAVVDAFVGDNAVGELLLLLLMTERNGRRKRFVVVIVETGDEKRRGR